MPPQTKPITSDVSSESATAMPRLQVDAGPSRKEVKDKIIER